MKNKKEIMEIANGLKEKCFAPGECTPEMFENLVNEIKKHLGNELFWDTIYHKDLQIMWFLLRDTGFELPSTRSDWDL